MTELRLKPKELLKTLREGKSVDLIHRSKPVATIQPIEEKTKVLDSRAIKELKKAIQSLNLPKTTYRERERRYRAHLIKKYGKGLPRH